MVSCLSKKYAIFMTLFITMFVGNLTLSETTQLIPCDVIDKLSPIHKVYHQKLFNHFMEYSDFKRNKPFFIMFVAPPFDLEYVIIVFKTHYNKFIVEKIISEENIWKTLSMQADRYGGLANAPQNAKFNFPSLHCFVIKPLTPTTADFVKKALEFAIKNRRYNPEELKSSNEYLDSTHFYFISDDNSCGWPSIELRPGPAKQLLIIGEVLEKYLNDKAEENEITTSANKVFQ